MEQEHFAGIIILVLGICGVTFNSIVVYFLRKTKSLSNPFGILTLNQAVTDLINSIVFAFIVAPTVLFAIPLPFEVTGRLGQLLFLAYDCCSWSHLCITLNRFTSVFFPLDYSRVFSKQRTIGYVLLIWTLAICINFFEYVFVDCAYHLPNGGWNFIFKGGDACKDIECEHMLGTRPKMEILLHTCSTRYLNYCRNLFITACIALLDIATLIRFRRFSRQQEATNTKSQKLLQKQEAFFMAQAMIQSILFYVELVCCYTLATLPFMESKWAQFGLRTIAWVTTHAADGLITLVCNGDLRRMFSKRMFGSKIGDSLTAVNRVNTCTAESVEELNV